MRLYGDTSLIKEKALHLQGLLFYNKFHTNGEPILN